MRKLYTAFTILLLAAGITIPTVFISGQTTVVINTGTAGTPAYNAGPIYRSSASSAYDASRYAYLYTQSELAAAGILPGSVITQLGWTKNNTATSTGGGIFRIYMKNSTVTDFAAASETWANLNSGTALVYENLNQTVPATTTPNYITFLLSNPFTYTGGSLEISTEWDINQVSGNPSTGTFDWLWSTVPNRIYGTGNTTLAPITSLSSTTNSISTLDDRRPFIQIVFGLGSGCTNPPAPGQATSDASASGVCPGTSVQLNWTVATTPGSGQTYKWQSSATQNGTYTDISAEQTTTSFVVAPTTTTWYRVLVKCNGGTAVPSDAVQVVVNSSLAAGTYTINNTQATGGTNFQSFTDAANSLKCGATGPVTFNVSADQVFNESFELVISNSVAVIFQKSGTGANPKILATGTSAITDYVVKLTGVDNVTFNGIDFEQAGSASTDWVEYGVYIVNKTPTDGATNNTIKNGIISLTASSANTRGVFISSAGNTPTNATGTNSNNRFLNMTVQNSFVGYYFAGITATYNDNANEIGIEAGGSSVIKNLGNGSVAGTIYGFYGSYQTNLQLRNTEITNVAGGGTSAIYNIYVISSASNSAEVASNNIHGITGGGAIYGYYMTAGDTLSLHDNQFHAINSTTATSAVVTAIDISATGMNAAIFNNRIYDISSAGLTTTAVTGIDVATGLEYTIHNNMISDLRAPASTSTTGGTKGIAVTSGSTGSVVRLYYNTVLLTDGGFSANYSSAGIYNSSVTPTLDIRNNIVVNRSQYTGNGKIVAFWKTSAVLNLSAATDNNIYFAGTPGPRNLIFFAAAGDSSQTIEEYKFRTGLTPRENVSQSEDVVFLPVTDGIVRIDPAVNSVAESGAQAIAGYNTDFENNARGPYPLTGQTNGGGLKPDIGADEYDGVPRDIIGPEITYTALVNTTSTGNRTITATITDISGVATGANMPRLYYRKGGSGAAFTIDASPVINGNQYTFTINTASIGGLTNGDSVEYYFAAQDLAGNVSTAPLGGSGINPPGTIAPTTLRQYKVLYLLSGTYTVGASGNFTNLTRIASLLNNDEAHINGHVIFEMQNDYDGTSGEIFPINFYPFVTNNPLWTVTFRPANGATGRVTSGDPGTTNPLINLDSVDHISFDGRPGGIGTTNEWTFRNTRTAATIGSVFRFINDATNDTLRYLNLEAQTTSTVYGVVFLSTSVSGVAGNSFNVITNNRIGGRTDGTPTTVVTGIYSTGTVTAPNSNNTISGNHFINTTNYGIYLSGDGNGNNWLLNGNHIYGDISTTATKYGIYITSDSALNTQISNNYIGGSQPNATGTMMVTGNVTVSGIYMTAGVANIMGNTISNVTNTNAGTSARVRGIHISSLVSGGIVSGNTISNLLTSGAGVGVAFGTQVAAGILLAPSGVFSRYAFTDNTIYNISVESTSALTSTNIVAGMALYNLQDSLVARNRIYDIRNKTTGTTANQPPIATGIFMSYMNNSKVVNNMVSLGNNESSNTQFAGIMQIGPGAGNTHNYFFNSIYVAGAAGGGWSSYGFVRGLDTNTAQNQVTVLRNNIFYITRAGGGSSNYVIGNKGTIPAGGWTSNYNNLYNTDVVSTAYWGTTGYDLAGFRTISGGDANSVATTVGFTDPTVADLHLTGVSAGNQQLGAPPIAGYTTDYDKQARSSTRPYMGADEAAINLPVTLYYFRGNRQGTIHNLFWKGECTGSNEFTVERSATGDRFMPIASTKVTSAECGQELKITDASPLPGINYYRLKMKDDNGKTTYSIVIAILNKENGFEIVSVFPVPVKDRLYLNTTATRTATLGYVITDAQGRTINKGVKMVPQGSALTSIEVRNLPGGSYILVCNTSEGYEKITWFIKE